MKLSSQLKYGTDGIPRVMPPEETIRRIRPYMQRIGVTRIADTTGLDTLGMPIFSAIRPTDAGLDGISVYNGKGLRKPDSLAGALMEAVERYCAETWHGERRQGTSLAMIEQEGDRAVMNPASMRLQQETPYDECTVLEWCQGWSLFDHRPVWIPLALILTPYYGPGQGIWTCSSNGLASGNNIEEALSHALAELIERDAYTTTTVRAQLAPRLAAFLDALRGRDGGRIEVPIDQSVAPSIRLDTVSGPVAGLVRAAQRDGSELWLRDMTSDLGIATFVASMRRCDTDGSELASGGFGCDPNSTIAAIRAITEAAQGRNVQIQGVREDASAARGKAPDRERVLWCQDSDRWICFDEVPSYENADILDDIRLMLDRLKAAGVAEAYAVDVSDPSIPASVVKVIIPEMESWFLHDFAEDKSRLGWRAQRYLPTA